CHPTEYLDWSSTRMARARTDPVFVAEFEAQGEPFVCRACHAPLFEQQPDVVHGLWWVRPLVPRVSPNPAYRPELEAEGVTCVACHLRDGAMVGPREPVGQPPHPVVVDPTFRSAATCAPCHQLEAPPLSRLERPISDTHGEWEAWGALTGDPRSCVDCHMPGG